MQPNLGRNNTNGVIDVKNESIQQDMEDGQAQAFRISRRKFLKTSAAGAVAATALSFGPFSLREIYAAASGSAPLPKVGKAVPVGSFSVVPFLDGPQSFALNLFNGADEATMLKVAGTQPVLGAFNVFLIRRDKELILVDTGNGTLRPDRTGQLPLCLEEAKVAPAGIDKILITHLHGDHMGGLVKEGKPFFPNAKVYLAKAEYDYWLNDDAMQQTPENRRGGFPLARGVLQVLEQNNLLVLFAPDEAITPGIASVDLPGHTPGHTGFMLVSEGKKLFFTGDLLHGADLQIPRPDITINFDVDQAKAKETRLRVFKQLAEGATPFAATHVPFPGMGILRVEGGGYRLEEL